VIANDSAGGGTGVDRQVRRPLLRYYGGKWRAAPWIISHFPEHRVYVEPFAGAASVFLRKPLAERSVLSDADPLLVNVLRRASLGLLCLSGFECLPRDPDLWADAFGVWRDALSDPRAANRADAFFLLSHWSFGGISCGSRKGRYTLSTGGRDRCGFAGRVETFRRLVDDHLPAIGEKLAKAEIVCDGWAGTAARHLDDPAALVYLDPPYPRSTRCRGHGYALEFEEADHLALLDAITGERVRARVAVSGYACPMYNDALAGWRRAERAARGEKAVKRTEVLWMNW
jgi:DNA adenine methylase